MIERRPDRPPRLARLISIAAHPLVLPPFVAALATRSARWTAIICASTIVPITAVILWKMRRGEWSDFDVSRREQRSSLYWFALPLFLAVILFVPAPAWFTRTMTALLAALTIGFLLQRFMKPSLHMLFAAFSAVVLWKVYPLSPLITVPLLPAVGWSRWRLGHHTVAEIIIGTILGLGAGAFAIVY
jgi:hypothetical protein